MWLVRSTPDDIGQQWISDWHPLSAKFQDYALNVFGGRNGNGNIVGLYRSAKGANEEWRNQNGGGPITKPHATGIQYHSEQVDYKITGTKPSDEEVTTVLTNKTSWPAQGHLSYLKTHLKSVSDSHKFSGQFSAELGAKLKLEENELVFDEKEQISVKFTFSFG